MSAPFLFWETFLFDSAAIESVNDLRSIARQEMLQIGLANAKINPSDVNGSTGDTIVAVTFIQLGTHKFVAVVMAAGLHALALRDSLIKKFSSVHFL